MLGYWEDFSFVPTFAIALCGGVLGVLFTIPLRRALIIEAGLRFPEGVATGEVLKAGTEGGAGAKEIAIAGVVGAGLKLLQTGLKLVAGSAHGSIQVGRSIFGFGTELGVALLAVGYIVGLNIAVLVLVGGLISWLFGIPIYMAIADPAELESIIGDETGYGAALEVWSARIRYMGVGAMATGGVYALVSLVGPIRDGIRASIEAVREVRSGQETHVLRTERDTPIHFVLGGVLVLAIPIFVVFLYTIDQDALEITTGLYVGTLIFGVVFSLVAGFLFSSVAGYMAGLVGSSNNPISGVTIATILVTSLILLAILGTQIDFAVETGKALAASATAIMVGGVVCCAAAIAGDNMQDLKAGRIVGATPYKQQMMQIVGVVAAAIAIAPVLQLLFHAYGLGDVLPREGMDAAEALKAPQATLMSSVADGVFARNLPWGMISGGAGIAVLIIVVDKILEAKESSFRTPVLAVAVGIYLPLELTVPIFLGGLVAHLAQKRAASQGGNHGLLFASGLITGEALVGILLAVPFAAFQSTDVLAIPVPDGYAIVGEVLGLAGLLGVAAWLYSVASKAR
jgi:putative OPT family oligopeptide transporter